MSNQGKSSEDLEAEADFEEIGSNDNQTFDLSNFQPYHSTFNEFRSFQSQQSDLAFGGDVSRLNLWSPPPSSTATMLRLDDIERDAAHRGSPATSTFFSSPPPPPPSGGDKRLIESSKSNILSIVCLLNEHILSHPFLVVRRQAQVNPHNVAYHLTPFTVIPVMARLQARQGLGTFFKGLPSSLLNYVLLLGSESILLSFLQLPGEVDFSFTSGFRAEEFGKHLLLKGLAYAIVTPFICSGAVEMVQSLIVGELPSPFESIREGLARIVHVGSDRKLAFHRLVLPSVVYHLTRYVMVECTKELIYYLYYSEADLDAQQSQHRAQIQPQPMPSANLANESNFFKTIDPEQTQPNAVVNASEEETGEFRVRLNRLKCLFLAHFLTDVVLYPFETILFRLFLQGTRTLIDNVDGRTAVIPLITSYDDATDCYDTILTSEGPAGLYKGFGALLLQYGLHYSIIHLTNFCIQTVFA